MTLKELLKETKEQGELLKVTRESTRPECIDAVRRLEAALADALDGDILSGLPLLDCLENGERFYGARARGRTIEGTLKDKPILIISEYGQLCMAARVEETFTSVPVSDDELLMEDVEDVTRSMEEVLRRHLLIVTRKTARYSQLAVLAEILKSSLTISWPYYRRNS